MSLSAKGRSDHEPFQAIRDKKEAKRREARAREEERIAEPPVTAEKVIDYVMTNTVMVHRYSVTQWCDGYYSAAPREHRDRYVGYEIFNSEIPFCDADPSTAQCGEAVAYGSQYEFHYSGIDNPFRNLDQEELSKLSQEHNGIVLSDLIDSRLYYQKLRQPYQEALDSKSSGVSALSTEG